MLIPHGYGSSPIIHISSYVGDGSFEIGFISPSPVIFTVRWVIDCYQLTIIVENQRGRDFLPDQFLIGGMEIKHTDCIFQIAKGRFLVPPHVINVLKLFKRF